MDSLQENKNQPILANLTHKFHEVDISDDIMSNLKSTIQWEITPSFPERGRRAWMVLDKPVKPQNWHSFHLNAIKIKGVGVYDPSIDAQNRDPLYKNALTKPLPPTVEPLNSFVGYPHLGYTQDGEFKVAFGDVAPIGGIIHDRAVNEFESAKHLIKHKIPSITPLAVYKYTDLPKFQGQYLGVVCSLSPNKLPFRLSEIQCGVALSPISRKNDPRFTFYNQIKEALEIEDFKDPAITQIKCLNKLAKQVGQLMFKFSESGLCRYSAGFHNFEYDIKLKSPVITDLDSTKFLDTIPEHLKPLEILRDLSSMVYHFTAKLATPKTLGKYNLNNILNENPLCSLIASYFGCQVDAKLIHISNLLWTVFIPHFLLLNGHKDEILNDWSVRRRRSYKMDHHFFFILTMNLIFDHFQNSIFGERYRNILDSKDDFLKKSQRFLGEDRAAYLEFLLKL